MNGRNRMPAEGHGTDRDPLTQQRYAEQRPIAPKLLGLGPVVFRIVQHIVDVDDVRLEEGARRRVALPGATGADRMTSAASAEKP